MKTNPTATSNQTQARALLADINGAASTSIPRRETIVDWLNAYLIRSDRKDYVMGESETGDLIALDQFLRTCDVPVTAQTAA